MYFRIEKNTKDTFDFNSKIDRLFSKGETSIRSCKALIEKKMPCIPTQNKSQSSEKLIVEVVAAECTHVHAGTHAHSKH